METNDRLIMEENKFEPRGQMNSLQNKPYSNFEHEYAGSSCAMAREWLVELAENLHMKYRNPIALVSFTFLEINTLWQTWGKWPEKCWLGLQRTSHMLNKFPRVLASRPLHSHIVFKINTLSHTRGSAVVLENLHSTLHISNNKLLYMEIQSNFRHGCLMQEEEWMPNAKMKYIFVKDNLMEIGRLQNLDEKIFP